MTPIKTRQNGFLLDRCDLQSAVENPRECERFGRIAVQGTQTEKAVSLLSLYYNASESSQAAQISRRVSASTVQRFNDFGCGSAALCSLVAVFSGCGVTSP
jgi:hypothetical protein